MARPRTNITLRYIYRKQPMLMVGRCKTSIETLTESLVCMLCVVSLIVLVGGIVEGL